MSKPKTPRIFVIPPARTQIKQTAAHEKRVYAARQFMFQVWIDDVVSGKAA